ncbi:MAG TPA: acyltransferase family protein [Marmoricola sp.]|jgi:fucose 4-O-acetylase-like acetyltransferase|nr:acyltransferase family protein [Marmoricola sp.]
MTTLRSEAVLDWAAVPDPAPAARQRTREPWFDNIKMALVTLVVVGHCWALLPRTTGTTWAYDFLYSWHMPAFAIITGYFSRSFTWTPRKLLSLVTAVAVPYVVFEYALSWFRDSVGSMSLHNLFFDPHWPMWYICALFFWRLAAPAFLGLPRPAALGLAVAISLSAGFFAPTTFDFGRILGFLPFFVLGLHVGSREWRRVRATSAVPWALGGLAAVFVLARFTDAWISKDWYYYTAQYHVLGASGLTAVIDRAGVIAVGLVGALCFFALVPRRRSWFSTLGSATLVVYLFHGFFVQYAKYQGFGDWAGGHVLLAFTLGTASAVCLALALAAPPVSRRLSVATDPWGALQRRLRAPDPTSA